MHGRTATTLAVALAFALLACGQALAANYQVTTLQDGTGVCNDDGITRCTLRSAISLANQTPAADTITVPAGTIHLTTAAGGSLGVGTSTTINGAGAAATVIDGSALGTRVLSITSTTATLSNLTLSGGRSTSPTSGAGGDLV